MKQGGRPIVLKGCKREHLRIRMTRNGVSRGFYARWRPEVRQYEFQLSGYGMKAHCFLGPSKGLALANLRLRSSVSPAFGWRWKFIDESTDWGAGNDPIGDWIFADTPTGPLPEFRTLPAASKDRVKQATAFFAP